MEGVGAEGVPQLLAVIGREELLDVGHVPKGLLETLGRNGIAVGLGLH